MTTRASSERSVAPSQRGADLKALLMQLKWTDCNLFTKLGLSHVQYPSRNGENGHLRIFSLYTCMHERICITEWLREQTLFWLRGNDDFVISNIKGSPLYQFSSSHSVVSDSLRPHGLQHAKSPCPSPTSGVYSNLCPLSRWCHKLLVMNKLAWLYWAPGHLVKWKIITDT